MRAAALLVVSVCTIACARERTLSPPPMAPRVEEPGELLPADLDLVVRLDVARLRALLGVDAPELVSQLQRAAPSDEPDRETARLLFALLLRAEAVWIGVRPGLDAELTDNVIVLRGDFRKQVPQPLGGEPRWYRGRDLGGNLLRFDRDPPRLRALPAVFYFRDPDLAVLGSVAEIDALDLRIDRGDGDPPLRAPESGLIALAARLDPLKEKLAQRAPVLSGLLAGAKRLEASLDRRGEAVRAQADVLFEDSARANAVASDLREWQGAASGAGRQWLKNVQIEPLERHLSLRLDLTFRELSHALHCFRGSGC